MESNSDGDYYQSLHDIIFSGISLQPLTSETIFAFLAIVVLLVCSALISGSEVAYFSLSQGNLNYIKENQNKKASLVIQLLDKPRLLLATILIANNLFNIGIIITSYFIISGLVDFQNNIILEFIFNAVVVTFILVLFGEVLPKVYANYNNISFALFMSQPLRFLTKIFMPISATLVNSSGYIEKKLGTKNSSAITKEEIDHAIEIAADESTSKEEIDILKSIVNFGNISVKQIMRSRVDILAIDIEVDFYELLNEVKEAGYSRIPVYRETIDQIEGILYVKDLLQYLHEDKDFTWQSLLRLPYYVPEFKKINDLLTELRTSRIHLAIVVDEYGGTAGIVTLEDIMEEIIGEIRDEYDEPIELDFEKIDNYNYIFEGKTLIYDFCKVIGVKPEIFEDVKGEADSLAGLLLEFTQKLPEQNEAIEYKNFRFEVLSVTNRRIQKVKITLLEEFDFVD